MLAVDETETLEETKGLKWRVRTLKSLKGSSDNNNAFPSGQETSLLIKIMVAADCNALS